MRDVPVDFRPDREDTSCALDCKVLRTVMGEARSWVEPLAILI
jgi:hypothetical protein